MRFVHQWFPLIVTIREGGIDSLELDELCAGFERYFLRGEPYAVLNASLLSARAPDALARLRVAEWANQGRVRSCSRELCAGSATVVARAWERHALTALQWLWTPVSPHESVGHVRAGIEFCVERLVASGVKLPGGAAAFSEDVYRGLAALDLAGLDEETQPRASPAISPAAIFPAAISPGMQRLEKLGDGDGSIVLGWLAPGLLWGCFRGYLDLPLCQAYLARLGELLRDTSGVRYFVDASALDSIELSARSLALRALLDQEPHFAQVIISNWTGGLSPAGRAALQALGNTILVLQDVCEFEAQLLQAAPGARHIIEAELRAIEAELRATRQPSVPR